MKTAPTNTTTAAPITAGDLSRMEPEFCRLEALERLYGIKRGTAYNLMADGLIKSVCLRRPGFRQGVRLVSLQSVRNFLASCQS